MPVNDRKMFQTCQIFRTRQVLISLSLILIALVISCQPPTRTFVESPNFKALVLSDTHISSDTSKTNRLQRLVNKINASYFPGVELVFVTGDVVSSVFGKYTPENPDTSDNRLRRAVSVLRQLKIPFYLAMGNHDHKIGNFRDSDAAWPEAEIKAMWKNWQAQTGFEPYYAVTHRGWKFLILNSMGGRHKNKHFDARQVRWLARELEENLPVVLFFHHPIQTDHFRLWCKPKDLGTPKTDPQFYALLKKYRDRIKGIFVGHGHMFISDRLYGTIGVYETDSFGEGTDTSFYVASFETRTGSLSVVRGDRLASMPAQRSGRFLQEKP